MKEISSSEYAIDHRLSRLRWMPRPFEFAAHFAWSPGVWAIQHALWPLLRKTLHPFSQGRVGKVEGLGDGFDVVTRPNLTDGLRTAKDTGLLGLVSTVAKVVMASLGKWLVRGRSILLREASWHPANT